MSIRRLITTLAIGAMAFASVAAAEGDFLLEDPAGDANASNAEGEGPADQGMGPFNADFADLLSYRVVQNQVASELRLGVVETDSPTPMFFRMISNIGGCDVWFQLSGSGGDMAGSIRLVDDCGDALAATYTDGLSTSVDEETGEYVLTVDFLKLPSELRGFVKPGAKAAGITLQARTYIGADGVGGATIPQVDYANDPAVTYNL